MQAQPQAIDIWNFIFNLLSLLGSIASLIGIPLAIYSVYQARDAARRAEKEAEASKEASQQARDAVERARRELRLVSNVIDFEKAIALLDDIKSFIHGSNLNPVPDKIATLIRLLNTVRSPSMEIGTDAETKIQRSVVALRKIENEIHLSLEQILSN